MRSIRLSLIVYFCALLGLTLAAAAWMLYQTAQDSLEARRESTARLLRAQHEERCRLEEEKLDEALLAEARAIANHAALRGDPPDPRFIPWLYPLGALSSAPGPNGHLTTPFWLAQGVRGRVGAQAFLLSATLKLREVPPADVEGGVTEYVQINVANGMEWRSPSMGADAFPFDRAGLAARALVDWQFDTTELRPGKEVRRVSLKVPRFRVHFDPPVFLKPTGPLPGPPLALATLLKEAGGTGPAFVVQAAADTGRLKATLADYRFQLDDNLDRLDESYSEDLRGLAQRLLLVSLLTFGATVLGGLWLVRAGLAPLRQLSEAVSKVSAKDFSLPLGPGPLPAELRPIADRLQQTLDQLRRAFDREKQAAADISHELRTPLAALMTTIHLALRKQRTAEEYRRLFEECKAGGEQMSQLVERMLALARLDAGADQLRRREMDAAELAEQCAALVRPLAQARGLSLRVHHDGPARLVADPDKLREVVTNLLHNAIEYNQPEGSVDLSVERDNGTLRLRVSDTGVGIPPEAREHVFERFYRADPSRHSEGVHAGIGLAIVKGYVEQMGGGIKLESTVGRGTTFTVTLPAADAEGP
jgi:signal transduction histidine kinase